METTNRTSNWVGAGLIVQPNVVAGTEFFVDNTNGSNSNGGRSWDQAFSTLNYAISQCTDASGDVIYLAPWHAETLNDAGTVSGTTTDECVIDKTHISIIGLGEGKNRPTFTLGTDDTTAAIVVTAGTTHVYIYNIIVISGLANVADGITFTSTSDGCTIEKCEFRDGGAALELVTAIAIAADCDDMAILDCNIFTTSGGGCAAGIELAGGSDRIKIIGNTIQGTYSAAAIDADAAASTEMVIMNNIICNQGALALGLDGGCTGINAYNGIAGTTSIAAAMTDESAMWNFENYVTGEDGGSGLLDPTADGD